MTSCIIEFYIEGTSFSGVLTMLVSRPSWPSLAPVALVSLSVAWIVGSPAHSAPSNCPSPGVDCCRGAPDYDDPLFQDNYAGDHLVVTTWLPTIPEDYVLVLMNLTKATNVGSGGQQFLWPPNSEAYRYHGPQTGPLDTWNRPNLGSIFGTTLDRWGNIYVAATSAYEYEDVTSDGLGAIFRIDWVTGEKSVFARLPNLATPLMEPGLGNLDYDCWNDQLFVSNMEDGRIYRLDRNGSVLESYHHGSRTDATGGILPGLPPVVLNGFEPLGKRVWAVKVARYGSTYRLFYSIWAEDEGRPDPAGANQVWSIELDPNGAFVPYTGALRIDMSPFAISGTDFSNPIADISFSGTGRLLIAERAMETDTEPSAHDARILEFGCFDDVWTQSNCSFLVGEDPPGNSAGGIDYDLGFGGRPWAMGDLLETGPPNYKLYGLQGFPYPPPGCVNVDISNTILIDLDGSYISHAKFQLGDVEIPCPECIAPPAGMCGWWPAEGPFDVTTDFTRPRSNGIIHGGAVHASSGLVGPTFVLDGNDYIEIPSNPDVNPSEALTVDAWFQTTDTSFGNIILHKHASGGPFGQGYAVSQDGMDALSFQYGDGMGNGDGVGLIVPPIADGRPHHVAITIDPVEVRLFLDGTVYYSTPWSGSAPHVVSNSQPLLIGGDGVSNFTGLIDEVELFGRALSDVEIQAIFRAGAGGKCRETCSVDLVSPQPGTVAVVAINATICNDSGQKHTYEWEIVPASTGCPEVPTGFSPASGVAEVLAGKCRTIFINVFGSTSSLSCYEFRAIATGVPGAVRMRCPGRVQALGAVGWDVIPQHAGTGGVVYLPFEPTAAVADTAFVQFRLENVADTTGTLGCEVRLEYPDGQLTGARFLGLAPGEVVETTATAGIGAFDVVFGTVFIPACDANRFHHAILAVDVDGSGIKEAVASVAIRAGETVTAVGVPSVGPTRGTMSDLRASPNPFVRSTVLRFELGRRGEVDARVYNVAGRLVRNLFQGPMAAGPQELTWDGRDALGRDISNGIYFVRVIAGGEVRQSKLVRVR